MEKIESSKTTNGGGWIKLAKKGDKAKVHIDVKVNPQNPQDPATNNPRIVKQDGFDKNKKDAQGNVLQVNRIHIDAYELSDPSKTVKSFRCGLRDGKGLVKLLEKGIFDIEIERMGVGTDTSYSFTPA